jgi:HK97 gp10 family phage protein
LHGEQFSVPVNLEFEWRGDAVRSEVDRHASQVMQNAGILAERTAQSLARVRTGFMRDSVYVIAESTVGGWVLIVGDSAPYAIFNELGTIHMSAQPFIRPAGDEAAQYIAQALGT